MLEHDDLKMFDKSPRVEIYCNNVNDILLNTTQEEQIKTFFRNKEYHLAIKLWLTLFRERDLITNNIEEFVKLIRYCKEIGMVGRRSARLFERHLVAEDKFLIAGSSLELRFSRKTYLRFLNKASSLNKDTTTYQTIHRHLKIFRTIGLHKSKTFLKSFKKFVEKIRHDISTDEYRKIKRGLKFSAGEKKRVKAEYDHFPPDSLYRFAKDKHIKELPEAKRPLWYINKSVHKKSISTGNSKKSQNFLTHQRDLFTKGMYYEALKNYVVKYMQDGTINTENRDKFAKMLRNCIQIGIINSEQTQILLDTVNSYLDNSSQFTK